MTSSNREDVIVRVASFRRGGRDGTLAVVTPDGERALPTPAGIGTLQAALDDWEASAPALAEVYEELLDDEALGEAVDADDWHAPLPRAYQWCEGSTYLAHMERMRQARGMELPPEHTREPIVYQAGADALLAPHDPIILPDESWGLDLEATLAVVTDDVPLGTTAAEAPGHVAFVVLLNDLTYRNLIPGEFAKRVGPYQAKPTRPFAPFAVAPDTLGELWDGKSLTATVKSWVNGELLGAVASDQDNVFDFAVMIEFAARTRQLAAGTIIGTGTVANRDPSSGYGCVGEKRAVELATTGEATTSWLRHGDTVRIEAFAPDGSSLFGATDQTVIPASPTVTTTERRPGDDRRRV